MKSDCGILLGFAECLDSVDPVVALVLELDVEIERADFLPGGVLRLQLRSMLLRLCFGWLVFERRSTVLRP